MAAGHIHTTRIRFGGLGGQGIVTAGRLLGKAACIYSGRDAVMTQAYGPEARGGACRSDVIISDNPVDYPYIIDPDILVVLFQEAWTKFRDGLATDTLIIAEQELVNTEGAIGNVLSQPFTRLAEELGNRAVTNVVMLGFLLGNRAVVERSAMEQAIRATLKPRVVDLNLRALEVGYELACPEQLVNQS
jgi:2-oxoglutarate ferredoxin oxidoreductase subunit gamma